LSKIPVPPGIRGTKQSNQNEIATPFGLAMTGWQEIATPFGLAMTGWQEIATALAPRNEISRIAGP
jgi:hypothetical protein